MQGVITAPGEIITGAFNIRFGFTEEIELTAADVTVETLEGDALGHSKDNFSGSGANYQVLCYLPDERSGKSRISVNKTGVKVKPVIVTYDTVKTVVATWGTPIRRGNRKIELPISFGVAIQQLKKRNFVLSQPLPFQLYGSGNTYSLVVPDRTGLTVTVSGAVRKSNGIRVSVTSTQWPVPS